jgi:hypothetical protein
VFREIELNDGIEQFSTGKNSLNNLTRTCFEKVDQGLNGISPSWLLVTRDHSLSISVWLWMWMCVKVSVGVSSSLKFLSSLWLGEKDLRESRL